MKKAALYYTFLDTPIGPFLLAGDGERLHRTGFSTGPQRRRPEPEWIHDPAAMRFASEPVDAYFAGERAPFDIPLRRTGTPFQRAVWDLLQRIPIGESRSYGELAHQLGKPGAARAVGSANGANTLPLIVPCHRVVGADGSLTGFGGGLPTKRWLLGFEGVRLEP